MCTLWQVIEDICDEIFINVKLFTLGRDVMSRFFYLGGPMIDPGLKDKVVLVTGTNNPQGIGAGIAKAFVEQGAKVFLSYCRTSPEEYGGDTEEANAATEFGMPFYLARKLFPIDEVLNALQALGGEVDAWEADLRNPEEMPKLFDRAEAAFGQVDILVNNAGVSFEDTTFDMTADTIDRTFDMNVRGTALMIAEFVKRFKNRQGEDGRIINISTDSAQCFPTNVSYGASKSAIEAYTRSVCWEVGPLGVRINTIAPGPIQTGYLSEKQVKEEVEGGIPLRRIGWPKDIANAAVFLASDQANWITGKVLRVDGGHIAFP